MIIAVVTKPFTACSCVGQWVSLHVYRGRLVCFHPPPPNPTPGLLITSTCHHVIYLFIRLFFFAVSLCSQQRSTSLDVALTNPECFPDVQSSRLSPGLACARRERRSQSIPAELAAPSTSAYCERPAGCSPSQETAAAAANKVTAASEAGPQPVVEMILKCRDSKHLLPCWSSYTQYHCGGERA